jgi:hypothetical protein
MDKNGASTQSKFYLNIWASVLSVFLILFLSECMIMKGNNQKDSSKTFYFTSPAAAIPIITDLLKQQNFKILAQYYDLSNSEIKLAEMESGDFFIRRERPEIAHPAGFWRYKHPFAPGFTFNSIHATDKKAVFMVEVSCSIDQGSDSPQQIGLSYFYMVKSDKGWKILPDQATENAHDTQEPKFIQ